MPFVQKKHDNLCRSLYNGPTATNECPFENCKFLHDIDEYLSDKFEDVGDTCPIYTTRGFCSFGITCRFAKQHIDENKRNIKSDSYDEKKSGDSFNFLSSGMNGNWPISMQVCTIIAQNCSNLAGKCPGLVKFGEKRPKLSKFDQKCLQLSRFGQIWLKLSKFGHKCRKFTKFGQKCLRLLKFGPKYLKLTTFDQNCRKLTKIGHVCVPKIGAEMLI